MTPLRFLLIGEGLVLAVAIERVRARGHEIAGIFANSSAEAATLARAGHLVTGPDANPAAFIAERDCDILLSIANRHVLGAAALGRPRIAAINYHNAPLPAYAGLRATAWAVMNGEAAHGTTWHIMEPGIDAGAILVQRRFPLADGETTGSLNARCTAAAIESFEELLDRIAIGDIAGHAQDRGSRSYYRGADTAPGNGVIDWRWTAEHVVRLVRACDWGPTPNDFGDAVLVAPNTMSFRVLSGEIADGSGPPGAVLAGEEETLTVACTEGAVRLKLDGPFPIEAGTHLPFPEDTRPEKSPVPTDVTRVANRKTISVETIFSLASALPDAAAIEDEDRIITRGELASGARKLAAKLVTEGLQPDGGVGILLPAGADFVIAALAAMRAGGAYVPLDPASPELRRAVEIEEAGVTHVVTSRSLAAALDLSAICVVVIEDGAVPADEPPLPRLSLDDCAYRIFTSGSTGRPKAVEVAHGALANLVAHYRDALPMGRDDRMTILAHPSFDASVGDIWPILAAGGTLLVPPEHLLLDPLGLIGWLASRQATCAFVPTAIAERLFGLAWPARMALRTLLTGGDTLHRRPPTGLPFRLVNTYGPTENTVDSLWATIAPGPGRPPIGRPIAGVTAALIDAEGLPVRDGEIGELVLGGTQVAKGYRGRPELTASVFQPDPAAPGRRRYRTGDRARLDAEGEFEFHGRIDDQLQLLGIRVEPGEIEALLKNDGRIVEAACVPLRTGEEVTGLVAHVAVGAADVPAEMLAQALHDMLAAHLPAAIVPRWVMIHPALPHTAAGKVDRLALAAIAPPDDGSPDTGGDADPIGAIWKRLLPQSAAESDRKSFWDLGGDSLKVIDLLLEVESATSVRVPIMHFLRDTTLDGLRQTVAAGENPQVVRLHAGAGPPLICWHGLSGDLEAYQHVAHLLGDREVIGIMSPAFGDEALLPESIEAAAAQGLSALHEFGCREPGALLGFSWAGLLAFEAARQLQATGKPPSFIGLIGTAPPFRRRGRMTRLAQLICWAPAAMWNRLRANKPTVERFRAAARRALRLLGPGGDLPPMPDWAARSLTRAHLAMGQRYRPLPVPPVKLHLFRERSTRRARDHLGYFHFDKPDLGWSSWAGAEPNVTWLEGEHWVVMKGETVAALAASIRRELDRAAG